MNNSRKHSNQNVCYNDKLGGGGFTLCSSLVLGLRLRGRQFKTWSAAWLRIPRNVRYSAMPKARSSYHLYRVESTRTVTSVKV